MLQDLLVAFALVLILEGLVPALMPGSYKRYLQQAAQLDTRSLRIAGLACLLLGAVCFRLLGS